MTFQELKDTVRRLENDPRVHPNTQIDVELEHDIDLDDRDTTTEPLNHIAIVDHRIVFAGTCAEPAVTR